MKSDRENLCKILHENNQSRLFLKSLKNKQWRFVDFFMASHTQLSVMIIQSFVSEMLNFFFLSNFKTFNFCYNGSCCYIAHLIFVL